MTGRVLTDTEAQLFNYLMDERQALAFAKLVSLPPNASYELIENTVILLLVKVKEARDGRVEVEVIHGMRRDTLRLQ